FQAEDGIRERNVTGVQTCALPICLLDEAVVGLGSLQSGDVAVARRIQALVGEVVADDPQQEKLATHAADVAAEAALLQPATPQRSQERRVGRDQGKSEEVCNEKGR